MTQEACFGFRGRPFQSAPQDELFVPLEPTVEAIEQLVQAAERGDGIGVLTAAPGAGKTVVCREVKARLERKFATVLLASCSFPTRRAMLQSILFEMGCEYARLSEQETRLHLLQAAQALMPERQGMVIIADEAHLLSARLLEELRCLTNHVEKGQPLIRVLVSGQLALEELLTTPQLQALNYRITCHATLEPLTLRQSAQYLEERMQHVGGEIGALFSEDALEAICRISDGNPRCLNQLADACLTFASAGGEVPLPASTVRRVVRDLKLLPLQWNDSVCDEVTDDGDAPLPASSRRERLTGREPSPAGQWDTVNSAQFKETHMPSDAKPSTEPAWANEVATIEVGAEEEHAVRAQSTGDIVSGDGISRGLDVGSGVSSHAEGPAVRVHDDLTQFGEVSRAAEPAGVRSAVEAGTPSGKPHATRHVPFCEWDVEDRYAVLDRANTGLLAALDEALSIDWYEGSVAAQAAVPRDSDVGVRELREGHREPRIELPTVDDDEHTEARIDRMIQAVSAAVTAEIARQFPAEQRIPERELPQRQQGGDVRRARWRAAPAMGTLDLVDPVVSAGPQASPLRVTEAATAANVLPPAMPAAAPPADDSGQKKSTPETRPYARLFSQARRLRIHS
jgi:type II secretory pathway predicted ATPase ExeA